MKKALLIGIISVLSGCAQEQQQESKAVELTRQQIQKQASNQSVAFVSSETKYGARWDNTGTTYRGVIVRHTFSIASEKGRDTLKSTFIVDSATAAIVPVKWEQ